MDTTRLALSGFTLTNLATGSSPGGGDDTPVALDRIEALSPQRVVIYTTQPLGRRPLSLDGRRQRNLRRAGNRSRSG
ncbi:MAG: hypothetical protein R3C99_15005 [Pirellulaceae bacterium]